MRKRKFLSIKYTRRYSYAKFGTFFLVPPGICHFGAVLVLEMYNICIKFEISVHIHYIGRKRDNVAPFCWDNGRHTVQVRERRSLRCRHL